MSILFYIAGIFGTPLEGEVGRQLETIITILIYAFVVPFILAAVAVSFRRIHDMDQTAWWLLLAFIPIANALLTVVLLGRPGTQGDNKFGPAP